MKAKSTIGALYGVATRAGGLELFQIAELLYVSLDTVKSWSCGRTPVPLWAVELLQFKTGQAKCGAWSKHADGTYLQSTRLASTH